MDQPGAGMDTHSAPGGGPEAIIAEALDVVLACLSGTDIPGEEIVPFMEEVFAAVADSAARVAELEPQMVRLGLVNPAATRSSETASAEDSAPPRLYTADEALASMSPGIEEKARSLLAPLGVIAEEVRAVPPEATAPAAQEEAGTPGEAEAAPLTLPLPLPDPRSPPARRKAPEKARRARPAPPASARSAEKAEAGVEAKAGSAAPAARKEARRPVPKPKAAPRPAPKEPKLPRGLKSVHEALRMDTIVCLEDGRRVKDLGAHLKAKGIDPKDYVAKWGLPDEYPMMAPSSILKRGHAWEYDLVTGRFRPVRV